MRAHYNRHPFNLLPNNNAMQQLSPNVLFNCALIPRYTMFVHREDVYNAESTSKTSTWMQVKKEYKDSLKVNKRENDAINGGAISVYQLDCTAHEEHQLTEPTSYACYMVDLSRLPNFFV